MPSSSWTMIGARPERQLVDEQHLGLVHERHGQGQHLLLAAGQVAGRRAPRRSASVGEPGEGRGRPAGRGRRPSRGSRPCAGSRRRVRLGEGGVAAHELDDADLRAQLGLGVGDGPAVEAHDAPAGHAEPADDPQQRRLAGAVGAEQRQRLARVARRGRRRRAPAPGRRRSRGCGPGSPARRRRRLVGTRSASAFSSSSSSTQREMSPRMYRAP